MVLCLAPAFYNIFLRHSSKYLKTPRVELAIKSLSGTGPETTANELVAETSMVFDAVKPGHKADVNR
jgi:hypothetical protein